MNPQLGKQFMVGALLGILVAGGIWFLLSDARAGLAEMNAANEKLDDEVEKGRRVKANYESLIGEVEEQERRIAELVALFPLDGERAKVAYSVQKLASASALGQVQNWVNADKPTKNDYYMEYATVYKYSGGFHEFGKFLSFASGYEKIINVSDIVMTRDSSKSVSNAAIEFRLSIFVYDPKSVVAAKAKPAAAKPGKEKEEED